VKDEINYDGRKKRGYHKRIARWHPDVMTEAGV